MDQKLVSEHLIIRGGKLRYRNQQRNGSAGARCTLQKPLARGLHHFDPSRRVDVAHMNAKPGEICHRLPNRIGDIVQLQIQKDFAALLCNPPYHLRTGTVEKLHADFDKRPAAAKLI